MKRFKYILRTIVADILICLTTGLSAGNIPGEKAREPLAQLDSVTISLLTCAPGQEIWAQYGHTAIRVKNAVTGQDVVVNYGMFSSRQPYFIPRFILGLTDYKMDVENFPQFLDEYAYEGRGVTEQVLNISNADKEAILKALADNCRPENITYRYNFFYDNCTTRARDMIVDHLHGKVVYPEKRHINDSFRDLIHEWNHDYQWAQMGEDLLLGVQADRHTTKSEQQFLPHNLQIDFNATTYNNEKLVKTENIILQPDTKIIEKEFPLSPMDCALFLLIIFGVVFYLEYKEKKVYWGADLFLLITSGLVGIILFIMVFSQHPCVRINLLLLIFNPLPLFFAPRAIKRLRKHKKDNWWLIWEILIILGIAGGLIQHYPIPVTIVALILLINCILKTTRQFKLQDAGNKK